MKEIIALILMVVLAGCQVREQQQQQQQQQQSAPVEQAPMAVQAESGIASTTNSMAQSGAAVAAELTAQYNDTRLNCGKASMPAFLCRGVMLRSTVASDAYSSWNPSPNSVRSGGVSFSYLSRDAKFSGLVYGQKNGFIFYPVLDRPVGTRQIEVLCAFPLDGGTSNRDKAGCGAHRLDLAGSGLCHTVGINLSNQWVARWNQYKVAYRMCGYDVSDTRNNLGADSFHRAILSHNKANIFPRQNAQSTYDYIELILKTWPQNIPKELPIRAFFYLDGGLPGAQHDQRDFFNKTDGRVIPIIKITLPRTASADAQFVFNSTDQVMR
jgi:hypothetical protein